jgi:hypothetical protein
MITLFESNLILLVFLLGLCGKHTKQSEHPAPREVAPPFHGTIFLDPGILTSSDSTAFENIRYAGQASRTMFDRRVNGWNKVKAFLFKTTFNDGLEIEIQVNPEFQDVAIAEVEATYYAREIGRLPTVLRKDVKTVWIHKGTQPFGGGNNNILIHTGQSEHYQKDGILEETLVHETSHTSLDAPHATSSAWKSAQQADTNFISTYARDNPFREDVAETFLLYLALRYRTDRISPELKATIEKTIPNRISYFDKLSLDMYPILRTPRKSGD